MFNKKYFEMPVISGLAFGCLLLGVSLFVAGGFEEKEKKSFKDGEIIEIRIGENIFQAEIASTLSKKNQGLSYRKDLCENCAMLFLFSERGRHSFWMKGMEFDLDMLWIDKNEVIFIAKDVSQAKGLERIKPDREADKVLEINAGLADKLRIKIGDKIEF